MFPISVTTTVTVESKKRRSLRSLRSLTTMRSKSTPTLTTIPPAYLRPAAVHDLPFGSPMHSDTDLLRRNVGDTAVHYSGLQKPRLYLRITTTIVLFAILGMLVAVNRTCPSPKDGKRMSNCNLPTTAISVVSDAVDSSID